METKNKYNSVVQNIIKVVGIKDDYSISDIMRTMMMMNKTPCTGINITGAWMCSACYLADLQEKSVEETSWNLSHDSLSWHKEHKPEIIEFLFSILCE